MQIFHFHREGFARRSRVGDRPGPSLRRPGATRRRGDASRLAANRLKHKGLGLRRIDTPPPPAISAASRDRSGNSSRRRRYFSFRSWISQLISHVQRFSVAVQRTCEEIRGEAGARTPRRRPVRRDHTGDVVVGDIGSSRRRRLVVSGRPGTDGTAVIGRRELRRERR